MAIAEIVIARRSALQVAPEAFFFEAKVGGFDAQGPAPGAVYDDRFHDLYYTWDFGDPYFFTAPENLPEDHKNANRAYGPWVSHTYRASGRYRVTLRVVEPTSGKEATATLDVAVGDPEALFAGRNTIFLSPSGDFGGAPAGAWRLASGDISAAYDTYVTGEEAAPKRLMLNRGEHFDFAGIAPGFRGPTPSFHIVAGPGTSPKPVAACSDGVFWNDMTTSTPGAHKDMIWQNLDLKASLDTRQPRDGVERPGFLAWFNNAPRLLLLDGCTVSGFTIAVLGAQADGDQGVVVNDTLITQFDSAILDATFAGFAITGSTIRAHEDALIDSTANGGWGARLAGEARLTVIHNSDFFIRQGWSGNGDIIATQPCLRLNGSSFEGARINCQANAFEGGYNIVTMGPGEGQPKKPINALFEKNYIVGGYQTAGMVNFGFGGTSIRNNIFLMPDVTQTLGVANPNVFAFLDGDNYGPPTVAANNDAPIRIYNNTMINRLGHDAYQWDVADNMAEVVNWQGYFTNITVANNVVHQTGTDAPMLGDAPLAAETSRFFTPRERGYQSATIDLRAETATLNTEGMFDTYAPLPGSAALGDAINDPVAYDDFYGNPRPQYPSRGALEMP